ncbi:MAG: hypothetical protein Q4A96_02470 [Candidatus Saccharibacteria bacterium]|nr:hypothetical protein [Candidatus Saccharibacteria bacterium]
MNPNSVNPYANPYGSAPNVGVNNPTIKNPANMQPGGDLDTSKFKRRDSGALGRLIALVIGCLLASAAIIALLIFFLKSRDIDLNSESWTAKAIESGKLEQQQEDDARYLEEDKKPFIEFKGVPSDLGALSFTYPRTWSVYVDEDGSNRSEYSAYFRPSEVLPTDKESSRYALRLKIVDRQYTEVQAEYNNNEGLTAVVGGTTKSDNGVSMIRYDGTIDEGITGSVVLVEINDKTAILQTDADTYEDDYELVLKSLKRNNMF